MNTLIFLLEKHTRHLSFIKQTMHGRVFRLYVEKCLTIIDVDKTISIIIVEGEFYRRYSEQFFQIWTPQIKCSDKKSRARNKLQLRGDREIWPWARYRWTTGQAGTPLWAVFRGGPAHEAQRKIAGRAGPRPTAR